MTATTSKGRATDEAFKDAARLVFARDGYLNAKISDIAEAAGRSPASFYNYYDTKADLLIALAEEFHAEATSLAALPFQAGLARPEALREMTNGSAWSSVKVRLTISTGEHPTEPRGSSAVQCVPRACSSGDRACASGAQGRRFDSYQAHCSAQPCGFSPGLRAIEQQPRMFTLAPRPVAGQPP